MKLYLTQKGIFLETEAAYWVPPAPEGWDALINRADLYSHLLDETHGLRPLATRPFTAADLLPPLRSQEIWAAGITYRRSRDARMEEARPAGGETLYDLVYQAPRPELFFKATACRTVGQGGNVRIRHDSDWNVPEPELTLFVCSSGQVVAYAIGNDMSSRSIEGENPLYLPQAKIYKGSAALGPCLYVPPRPLPLQTPIQMQIWRNQQVVFSGETSLDAMKRSPQELIDFLFSENEFPHGCFLMTGTGIVPPDDFTLFPQDRIAITIPPIGTLTNVVA